jgi:hypothetical protein
LNPKRHCAGQGLQYKAVRIGQYHTGVRNY